VVKQLPVGMLQQMLECKQLYADMHWHGGALHQMSAFHTFCSTIQNVADLTGSTLLWHRHIKTYSSIQVPNSGGDYVEK
jgi:hypothetical protein